MNGMSDFSEPLKLSEKQLRIELDWDRTLDGDRNYSKRTEVLTGRFDFDDRRKIRDLEMLIKPNLDPEFWSDLLKTRVKFGGTQLYSTHISMMSNIIFCALAGYFLLDLFESLICVVLCFDKPLAKCILFCKCSRAQRFFK